MKKTKQELSLHVLTINRAINLPTVNSGSQLYCRSGVRSEPKIGWSGAERWAGIAEKRRSEAERGAGSRAAETERWTGVTEIGWSAERLFRRSRSAHMLRLLILQTVIQKP